MLPLFFFYSFFFWSCFLVSVLCQFLKTLQNQAERKPNLCQTPYTQINTDMQAVNIMPILIIST